MRTLFLTMAASFVLASPAAASIAYSNNFDAENGGLSQLNYSGFNGLTVTDGTVDLVRSGDFGITCAGATGSCVDLDGSTSNSGLTSSANFAFASGDRVSLSYLFSGNQRGGAVDSFIARLLFGGTVTGTWGYNTDLYGNVDLGNFAGSQLGLTISNIASGQAMSAVEFYFVASNAGSVIFNFEDFGNDNVGVVLDDVSLDIGAVPEPSAWAMLVLGFGVIGSAARRRQKTFRIIAS